MNMRYEQSPVLSSEDQAKKEKQQQKNEQKRNLSDIRLRLEGAEAKLGVEGRGLKVTDKQLENAQKEMEREMGPMLEKRLKRQVDFEQKRNLSDIRLRLEGAETQAEGQGKPWLEATPKQKEAATEEMNKDLEARQFVKEHSNWFVRKAYEIGGAGAVGVLKGIGKVFGFLKNIFKEAFRIIVGTIFAGGGVLAGGVVGIGAYMKKIKGAWK